MHVKLLANLGSPSIRARTIDRIMDLLREATHPSPAVVSDRLTYAQNWIHWSREYNHESQLEAMIETLTIVDESVGQTRSLQSLFQHISENRLIQQTQTVASDAAALAIDHGDVSLASALLERGRTIIFSQLGRFRQTQADIEDAAPELAQKFIGLSDLLNDLVLHGEESTAFRNATGGTTKDLGVV